jgi:hypothetical protein
MAGRCPLNGWIHAKNAYLTTIAAAEAFKNLYSRCLASTVWAKKGEYFALMDIKIYSSNSVERAVALLQISNLYNAAHIATMLQELKKYEKIDA